MSDKLVYVQTQLDNDTYKKLKVKAIMEDSTVSSILAELVRKALK